MKPTIPVKFGLLTIATMLAVAFAWSGAQGQFGPPRPPIIRPGFRGGQPGMNPPFGINGGQPPFGINGGPAGMNPPGFNPGMPGMGPNITIWQCETCKREIARGGPAPTKCPFCGVVFNEIHMNGQGGPAIPIPPNPGFTPPAPPMFPSSPPLDSSSPTSTGVSSKGRMIALVVSLVVVGVFVILGGTFLLIYLTKNNAKPRRRRRRDDEDDYDRD